MRDLLPSGIIENASKLAKPAVWLMFLLVFNVLTTVVASANGTAAVPVPSVVIKPGDMIRDSQIVEKDFDARIRTRQFYQSTRDVIGKMARRVLLPGRPIPVAALKEAFLVSAGDTVTVKFNAVGLEVTGQALALQSGRLGETVSCRNVDTGVVIRGKVVDAAIVQTGID